MPGRILTYYSKHSKLVEENLLGCADPQDIEAIHNLRLSIKRIRVVAKLADQLSNGSFNAKVSLAELNKFFKSSGRLRDIQVIKELLFNLGDKNIEAVIEDFSQKEEKQRKKFEKSLKSFDIKTLADIEIRLSDHLHDIKPDIVKAGAIILLSNYIHDIHEIFHSRVDEKKMHDIRTRLKDINYLNNIFDDSLRIEDYLNIQSYRLRELGEMAGKWHDHLNLEQKLGKFIHSNTDLPEKEHIQEIVKQLRISKEGLHQEYKCILLNEMKV